jgi:hypothetical protein
MKKKSIPSLAYINGMPCVTISMNTPAYKDQKQLQQELLQLVNEAKLLLLNRYNGIPLNTTLDKIDAATRKVSFNGDIKSITLFISENVEEILASAWRVPQNNIWVADYFDVRPLITVHNTSEEYFILKFDRSAVHLYHASDNKIVQEIKDSDFPVDAPFPLTQRYRITDRSYGKIDEFLTGLDKKLICRYNTTSMRYVIASCSTTYKRFIKHVRFQSIYAAYIPIRTETGIDTLVTKAWKMLLIDRKKESVRNVLIMKKLIANGEALTRYPEILSAARQGKGELLVVSEDILRKEDKGDASCEIIWDIVKHKGKVIFADREEMEDTVPMALKLKY